MKETIKNILKEEQEYGELEQRFRNSMQKLQYIFESNISSEIDSVDISEIEFDPKYIQIRAKLTVKSYYEDHDFGSIGRHADTVVEERSLGGVSILSHIV